MEAPDESRIMEFSRGIDIGSNGSIPIGGHDLPISTAGETLQWKNAQKNLTKKRTSDRMNIAILYFVILTMVLV